MRQRKVHLALAEREISHREVFQEPMVRNALRYRPEPYSEKIGGDKMTDYSKLVKALRCKGLSKECDSCGYGFRYCPDSECNDACDRTKLENDAAAAIEALQAEVERLKDSNEELREKQTFIDHYGAEWLTSAKDVPTAAYKHGYADGFAEAMAKMEAQE